MSLFSLIMYKMYAASKHSLTQGYVVSSVVVLVVLSLQLGSFFLEDTYLARPCCSLCSDEVHQYNGIYTLVFCFQLQEEALRRQREQEIALRRQREEEERQQQEEALRRLEERRREEEERRQREELIRKQVKNGKKDLLYLITESVKTIKL